MLFNTALRRGVLDTILYSKLSAGLWFSPGTPESSTNKTDCYDITGILLKVALNTITSLYKTLVVNVFNGLIACLIQMCFKVL
jgi:hypothetical protein